MRIVLFIFTFLVSKILISQSTFNSSYTLPSGPLTFRSVNIGPDGFLVSGTYSDTTNSGFIGLSIFSLSHDGELQTHQEFGSETREFLGIGHSMSYLSDQFIHQCTGQVNDTMYSEIIWYTNLTDTLQTIKYQSHHLGEGFENDENIQTIYAVLNPDSSVYMSNVVWGETTFNDASLQKLDKYGNTLWIYDHATMSDPDRIRGVVMASEGVICSIQESGYTGTPTNHAIIKLNNDGELVWQINSSDFLPGTQLQGTIVLDDNAIVVSSSFEEPGLEGVYSIASVYKVDTLGNLIWHTTYGEYNDYAWRDFTNIVQTTDNNYVAAGTWKTIPGSEEIPEGQTSVDYDEFAYVVKFDREDGSIIWDRKYRWLEVYRDNHTLRDMKATPDGGVIFCGEVQDLYMQQFEDFSQRGWVVKLDECGCLVPGCDTLCTDIGVREQSGVLPLLLSPNPASDMLNVHVGDYSLSKGRDAMHGASALQIIDLSGRIVSTHRIPANNTTYMMRVDELPAGNYVVRLMNDGRVAATGTVVVM